MKKRAKPNRRQIGLQKVESSKMCWEGVRKGKRKKMRGRVKRSWSGYETSSDLVWHVYESVFFSLFFFQALRCRLELDWVVASDELKEKRDPSKGGSVLYCPFN